MKFTDLNLVPELIRAIEREGYSVPTPVQELAIPPILLGKDVLAGAQTGTGKTASFTLPILQHLFKNPVKRTNKVRALILTPTRELASQIKDSVDRYGKFTSARSTVVFGGVGFNPQAKALRAGVDVLIATPGRLLDHLQQGTVNLSHVEILVLDEADRMLDMGFIKDIRRVLKVLPPCGVSGRQNLLFSATFSQEIRELAKGFMSNPEFIQVENVNSTVDLVEQLVFPVDKTRKRELLSYLIGSRQWGQVLVFTRTKHRANRLAAQLTDDGIKAAAIHGNKSQGARTRSLKQFKDKQISVLVATDIAARGIDIDQLSYVVNFELPNVPQDYVHRIGRTGRAGRNGLAVSLVSVDELSFLRGIEKLINQKIPKEIVDGFKPDPNIKVVAEKKNSNSGNFRRKKTSFRAKKPSAGRRDSGAAGKKTRSRRGPR